MRLCAQPVRDVSGVDRHAVDDVLRCKKKKWREIFSVFFCCCKKLLEMKRLGIRACAKRWKKYSLARELPTLQCEKCDDADECEEEHDDHGRHHRISVPRDARSARPLSSLQISGCEIRSIRAR